MINANGTVKSHYKISDTAGGFTGGLDDVDNFGHAVEALGDIDGDGVTDIAVDAEYDTDSGKQRGATWILYLNADGTVKNHFKINYATPGFEGQLDRFDEFGQDVTNIGDLNGDGIADLAAAADGDDDGGDHRGSVYVFFLEAGTGANRAPVLAPIGNKTVTEGQLLTFIVSAGDADGPAPLVLTHTVLPDGASFVDHGNGSGTFSWTPAAGDSDASPYSLTFTATEDGGSGLSDEETIVITVNESNASGSVPMESGLVAGVDENWITVNLTGSYNSPVVVASPNYDEGSPPLVVRIRNAAADSFQMRVVNVNNPAANIAGVDVYYFVVEAGVYTVAANGIKMEAVRFNSTVTDRQNSWVGQQRSYANSYTAPVIVGQVMTENDAGFSVFWSRGPSRQEAPTPSAFFAGKHVGEDSDTTRANETIGYVVIEAGVYDFDGRRLIAGLGAMQVEGIDDSPPYSYGLSNLSNATAAVVSQAGMQGGNGGWSVLYGDNPISDTALDLAVDEDQIRDAERSHTNPERVAYVVLR